MPAWRCALAVAPALCLLALSGAATAQPRAAAAAASPIAPPPLTGQSPVGTYSLHLIDRSRTDRSMPSGHRDLMVQLWYPAATATGELARYMPAKIAALLEQEDHLPAGTISHIRVHAYAHPAVADGAHPVVLFSPGSSEMRSADTALVEDLASSGYIVIALDHTHESELVEFPGGRIVRGNFVDTGRTSNERALRTRVADARFILDQLPNLNRRGALAGHLKLDDTGIFGFSLGGATAAATMLADRRLKVGADLDGSIYGSVERRGLRRPFLLMLEPRVFHHDPSISAFVPHLRGPHLIAGIEQSAHESFTDFVWIKPQLARISHTAAAQLEVGTIGPTATREESTYLTAFFDRYLRHQPESLLKHPPSSDHHVVFFR
jgi:dienelactone hydrolase